MGLNCGLDAKQENDVRKCDADSMESDFILTINLLIKY